MALHKLTTPLAEKDIKKLRVKDKVLLSGTLFTARDMAHLRMLRTLKEKKAAPFNLKNAVIYYCGPTPAKPGRIIGSAGPTTAGRMDGMVIPLLKKGLKGMIGKGERNKEVRDALKKFEAVYFVAAPGAGALLSTYIKSAKVIAYGDLGPEAVTELKVENFPVIVANDALGGDIFEQGVKQWRIK